MPKKRAVWSPLLAAVLIVGFICCAEDKGKTKEEKSSGSLGRANTQSEAVDRLFAGWDKPKTPGASVAVWQAGKVLHQKSYGRKHIGYDLPWNPDTRSRIYSMTKHFMGVAALILEDRRDLSLDDDVRQHLPDWPAYEEKITLRHILSNTSGIRDDEQILTFSGLMDGAMVSLDYYYQTVARQKRLNFPPGAACLYSNSGFRMMARIIERLSGRAFPDWMANNIFKPLGMDRTLVAQYDTLVIEDMAQGYDRQRNGSYEPAIHIFGTSGDGAIVSTVPDMLKWADNFMSNRLHIKNFPERLVAKTPLTDGRLSHYGLGICTDIYRGVRRYHHGGGAPGYRSEITYFPDRDLAVVILANRSDANPGQKAEAIADIYLEDDIRNAEKQKGELFQPRREALEPLKGTYVDPETGLVAQIAVPDANPSIDLYLGGTAGFISPLKAVDEKTFASAIGYSSTRMQIEYREHGERPLLHIDLGRGGFTTFVPAVDVNPTAQQLEQYEGVYRSDEIAAPLSVLLKEGNLFLRLGFGVWPTQLRELEPVYPDIFSAPGISVKFVNRAKHVKSLIINTAQSRYFELKKVN